MMPPPQVQVYPQPKRDGALESYADLSEAKRGRLGCRPRPGASWCTGKRVVLVRYIRDFKIYDATTATTRLQHKAILQAKQA